MNLCWLPQARFTFSEDKQALLNCASFHPNVDTLNRLREPTLQISKSNFCIWKLLTFDCSEVCIKGGFPSLGRDKGLLRWHLPCEGGQGANLVILRPDRLLSIHLTTYLTEAAKFHKAFSGHMKNIIKTNYSCYGEQFGYKQHNSI